MKTLRLEIDTTDRSLANDLSGGQYDVDPDKAVALPGNATLKIDHLIKRYAVDVPETIVALLDVGKDVAIGLVSAWLYDKLKGRAKTLKIEETEVRVVQSEIELMIKHKLEKKEPEGIRIFEIWKEYEKIAMHFNELLIKLRVQALGGIAAISALVGFLSKGDTPEDFRWGAFAGVFLILILVWVAIWFLDVRYYNRLLLGAVAGILQIEQKSKTHTHINELELSHIIEQAARGEKIPDLKGPGFWSGRHWFYILVLFSLFLALWFSTYEHCLKAPENALVHTHGICTLASHWSGR